jgi:hypothetical protein
MLGTELVQSKNTRLLARCAFSFSFDPVVGPTPPAHPFLASSQCQRAGDLRLRQRQNQPRKVRPVTAPRRFGEAGL